MNEAERQRHRERRQQKAQIEQQARDVARAIKQDTERYNAMHPGKPDIGFCLILFELGEPGRLLTYMADAEREGMIATLEELTEKLKAGK